MEKIFTNKKIWKMLIVAILVIMAVQVVTPTTVVFATDDDTDVAQEGDNVLDKGVLMRPILSFLVSIGDGAMSLLHSTIMGRIETLIPIDLHEGNIIWTLVKDVIMGIILGATALLILKIAGPICVIAAAVSAVAGGVIGVPVLAPVEDAAVSSMHAVAKLISKDDTPDNLNLPIYSYSPEEIFEGKILLFNVNFFGDKIEIQEKRNAESGDLEYYYYVDSNSNTLIEDKDGNQVKGHITSQLDSAAILKNTISQWYVVLRNICIVAMLSVLVYIGIRMMLTTIANDKAKYKEMFKDWLVGICLLFVMHYIMAFSVTLVEKFTGMISTAVDKNVYTIVLHAKNGNEEVGITGAKLEKLKKALEEHEGIKEYTTDENGNIVWTSNLMGYLRLSLQFDKAGGQYIGELLCFLALVILTIMFTWIYFKRLLYMAFLTIISPFVALTYCIDKVNDGQAQGFNTWLKEYIFNLLLQPMHLLIYFILVTSAFDLAGTNVLYSIAAILCMIPAEKMLRGIFGFQKAHTPPMLGGPMGTALIVQGINKLTGAFGGKGSGGRSLAGSSSKSSSEILEAKPPKTQNTPAMGDVLTGATSSTTADTIESLDQEQQELVQLRTEQANANGGQLSDTDRLAYWNRQIDLNRRRAALNSTDSPAEVSSWARSVRGGYEGLRDTVSGGLNRAGSFIADTGPVRFVRDKIITGARGGLHKAASSIDSNMSHIAPQHWRRVKWGAQVAGTYAKNAGKRALRNAPGAIAGGVVGVTAAGLGAAAGIASGDPSKVATGTAAGITAGMATARGVGPVSSSDLMWPELREAIEEVNNSNPEYRDNNMESYIRRARKDDGIWKQLETMDKETADAMKENGHFDDYLRLGYGTDEKGLQDMIASERMIQDRSRETRMIDTPDKASAVRKSANRMGDINKLTEDKKGKWHSTFAKEYESYGELADSMATQTINLAEMFDKNRPR